jgi:hypothetical protein
VVTSRPFDVVISSYFEPAGDNLSTMRPARGRRSYPGWHKAPEEPVVGFRPAAVPPWLAIPVECWEPSSVPNSKEHEEDEELHELRTHSIWWLF